MAEYVVLNAGGLNFAVETANTAIPVTYIDVADNAELNTALSGTLGPGYTIRIAPGTYTGYHEMVSKSGSELAPITVTALDPVNPPVFSASSSASIKTYDCSYVVFDHLVIENPADIGIHISATDAPGFDTLSTSNHITLSNLVITNTGNGDWGNHDSIKMAGTDYFLIDNVELRVWGKGGGSAIDVIGSQHGVIQNSLCQFTAVSAGTSVGINCKGGSKDIKIRYSKFDCAGTECLQVGQDTGIVYLRDAPGTMLLDGVYDYEAKDIEIYGNVLIGSEALIMYMKSHDSSIHHNTLIAPFPTTGGLSRSIIKITSASNDGLVRAHTGTFENNLIVYFYGGLMTWSQPFCRNSADGAPELSTFTYANNAWYQLDVASRGTHLPNVVGNLGLVTAEVNPVYQVDPALAGLNYETGAYDIDLIAMTSSDPALAGVGADNAP